MRRGRAQCALACILSAAVRVRAIASEKTEVVVRVKLARVSVEAGFDGYDSFSSGGGNWHLYAVLQLKSTFCGHHRRLQFPC